MKRYSLAAGIVAAVLVEAAILVRISTYVQSYGYDQNGGAARSYAEGMGFSLPFAFAAFVFAYYSVQFVIEAVQKRKR